MFEMTREEAEEIISEVQKAFSAMENVLRAADHIENDECRRETRVAILESIAAIDLGILSKIEKLYPDLQL